MAVFDHDASPAATRERLRTYELALVPRPSDILWPIPAIRRAARTGLVNLATDQAGVPRYVPMIFRRGDAVVPSFALAAAAAALNTEPVLGSDTLKLAGHSVSMDLGYHLPIRHYGPRGTIRQVSAARALGGNLDPNEVRGQIVIIGATAVALGDTFATPFDRIVPGVEIFATAISNLLAGDGLVKTNLIRRIDAGAAIVLAVLTVVFMGFRRTWIGLGLAVALFVLWGAMTFGAFLAGYWLSVAVPVAAVMPVAVAYGFSRIGFDRYVATRLAGERAALTRFQSPLLIDHIVRNPSFLEKPVRQEVAVVFLDLSGFTGVAEALGPEWTRDLLADFQAVVERAVLPHGGFVVSFMGDGAMIVFGLPEPRPDDAARAVVAVMGLHRAILGWLAALPPIARERLSVRIGGHCGPVVVSRLGPVHHQHVTATGDTVNATSRLLEVAKQQRCSVVITEHLFAAASLAESSDDAQAIGPPLDVDIRGRAQPLRIRVVK
jgi:adenylate cyclase